MSEIISSDEKLKQYKYLLPLAMLFITIMLTCAVLIYKPVKMWFGYASGATLFFPCWFVLSDIIAEVYGLKVSKKILLTAFFCQLLFSLVCMLIVKLPGPAGWQHQPAFNLILGHLFRITLCTIFTLSIAGYINMYLVTRWKISLKGKYFWMRSSGAAIFGEGIYSIIAVLLMQYRVVPLFDIPMIIVWAYLSKICTTIVLTPPASMLCAFIKISEKVDVYDNSGLNPFK